MQKYDLITCKGVIPQYNTTQVKEKMVISFSLTDCSAAMQSSLWFYIRNVIMRLGATSGSTPHTAAVCTLVSECSQTITSLVLGTYSNLPVTWAPSDSHP